MKMVIACILAFYVVLLSCIPCQDEAELPLSDSKQIVAVHAGQDSHSEAMDLCSPFCICACCTSVTIMTAPSSLPANNLANFIQAPEFAYTQLDYTGDLTGIWQPPKNRM